MLSDRKPLRKHVFQIKPRAHDGFPCTSAQIYHLPQNRSGEEHSGPGVAGFQDPRQGAVQRRLRQVRRQSAAIISVFPVRIRRDLVFNKQQDVMCKPNSEFFVVPVHIW